MRDCKALRTWLQLAVALTGPACTTPRVVQRPLSPARISDIALGAVAGLASGDDHCPSSGSFSSGSWCFFRFSAQEKAGLGAVGLGLVGMLVGGIVGGLAGAHAEVVLR